MTDSAKWQRLNIRVFPVVCRLQSHRSPPAEIGLGLDCLFRPEAEIRSKKKEACYRPPAQLGRESKQCAKCDTLFWKLNCTKYNLTFKKKGPVLHTGKFGVRRTKEIRIVEKAVTLDEGPLRRPQGSAASRFFQCRFHSEQNAANVE